MNHAPVDLNKEDGSFIRYSDDVKDVLFRDQYFNIDSGVDSDVVREAKTDLRKEIENIRKDQLQFEYDRQTKIENIKNSVESRNEKLSYRNLRETCALRFSDISYVVMLSWLAMIGFHEYSCYISGRPLLSDKAILIITTGATVNVLSAFNNIIKGLFK